MVGASFLLIFYTKEAVSSIMISLFFFDYSDT